MCFFLRCNGTQVYSIVRESKKEVNITTIISTFHHFDMIFKILIRTKSDPLAGGTELTSPWPFEPRNQHAHILALPSRRSRSVPSSLLFVQADTVPSSLSWSACFTTAHFWPKLSRRFLVWPLPGSSMLIVTSGISRHFPLWMWTHQLF